MFYLSSKSTAKPLLYVATFVGALYMFEYCTYTNQAMVRCVCVFVFVLVIRCRLIFRFFFFKKNSHHTPFCRSASTSGKWLNTRQRSSSCWRITPRDLRAMCVKQKEKQSNQKTKNKNKKENKKKKKQNKNNNNKKKTTTTTIMR